MVSDAEAAAGADADIERPWLPELGWFAAGAVAAFLVPLMLTSVLELQHDVYLGIYFCFVLGLLAAYTRSRRIDLAEALRRNWRWGILAGVVLGVPIVGNVFSEDATPHPDGLYFAFELVWRGAVYGVADAALLTVFPCLVALHVLGPPLRTWGRRLTYFGASLAMVVTITATYHLGYEHYRDEGVGGPETGNALISLPMLLTTNPIGSALDHGAMHVAAVAHNYEGETRLPPETEAD
jgi:hypothetical protein